VPSGDPACCGIFTVATRAITAARAGCIRPLQRRWPVARFLRFRGAKYISRETRFFILLYVLIEFSGCNTTWEAHKFWGLCTRMPPWLRTWYSGLLGTTKNNFYVWTFYREKMNFFKIPKPKFFFILSRIENTACM